MIGTQEKTAASKLKKVMEALQNSGPLGSEQYRLILARLGKGKGTFTKAYKALQESPSPSRNKEALRDILSQRRILSTTNTIDPEVVKTTDKAQKRVVADYLKELKKKGITINSTSRPSGKRVYPPNSEIKDRDTIRGKGRKGLTINNIQMNRDWYTNASMSLEPLYRRDAFLRTGLGDIGTFDRKAGKKARKNTFDKTRGGVGTHHRAYKHEYQEAKEALRSRPNSSPLVPKGIGAENPRISAYTGHQSLGPIVAESEGGRPLRLRKPEKITGKDPEQREKYVVGTNIEMRRLRQGSHGVGGHTIPLEGRAVGRLNIQAEKDLKKYLEDKPEELAREYARRREEVLTGKGTRKEKKKRLKSVDKDMKKYALEELNSVVPRDLPVRGDTKYTGNRLTAKYLEKAQKPHGPRKKEGPALDYGNNN